jgi:hypothetical protein
METQFKEQGYINDSSEAAIESTNTESFQVSQVPAELDSQAQRINKQVSDFFAKLPEKTSRFYQEYKLPIISFALLVATIITFRVALAILGAINDIPLVRPIFELVGMSYTVWFISRYLLKDSTRKELLAEFQSAKNQILGKTSSLS